MGAKRPENIVVDKKEMGYFQFFVNQMVPYLFL